MKIATIGSREINDELATTMEAIGSYIVSSGHVLASGNAIGSDQAYARGGNKINPENVWLYIPWGKYEAQARVLGNLCILTDDEEAINLAKQHHKAWDYLTQGAKKLMVRNACIIRGSDLVIAYLNPKKKWGGGTSHGVRIAEALGIKTILLKDQTFTEIKKEIDAVCG